MDRSLKERLVGAAVLVALAVWLVPQVLDGPDDGGERKVESLTLPAPAEDTGLRTQRISLDDKRAQPAPVPQVADAPAERAGAAKPSIVSEPQATTPKRAAATAPSGDWFVQLGSFADRGNANRLADEVAELGFKTAVSRHNVGTTLLHRVRVGPRPSRVAAEALASDLARRGFKGQVVQDG